MLLLFVILIFDAASRRKVGLWKLTNNLVFLLGRMASVAVKSTTAAKSTGTEEKGTVKTADLVFEDDDFEEFPGEAIHAIFLVIDNLK